MAGFTEEQKAQWKANRKLSVHALIVRMPDEVRPYAEVVGKWVWVTFLVKPEEAVLAKLRALGFKWNSKRKVWQHPCGRFTKSSPGDPRKKYGTVAVEELVED